MASSNKMASKTTNKRTVSIKACNNHLFNQAEKREKAPIIPDISLLAHLTPEQRSKVIAQGEAIRQTTYYNWLRNIERDSREVVQQIGHSYGLSPADSLGDKNSNYEEQ